MSGPVPAPVPAPASAPAGATGPGPRRLPRWPLRRTLVVLVIAAVSIACFAIGVACTAAVQAKLMERIDEKLVASIDRIEHPAPGPVEPSVGDTLGRPGQGPGNLIVVLTDDGRSASGYLEDGAISSVPGDAVTTIASAVPIPSPRSFQLGGDLGNYRLASVEVDDGVTVVYGLPLAETDQTIGTLTTAFFGLSLLVIVVVAFGAGLVVRRSMRPLERVVAIASQVSGTDLENGSDALTVRVDPEFSDTRTEAGRVGAALNRMLDHIARAFERRDESERRLRAFAADASHELRTPLASIRGYAEITRLSGETLEPDTAYALSRIEHEAKRMGVIVEDLLLLARLDQGRPIDRVPVDLTELCRGCASDAQVAGEDHEVSSVVPDTPVIVEGDAVRLQQVIGNLLTNARTHTRPGTHIRLGLEVRDGRAIIEVADDGEGIDPRLLPHVFERFVRGDGSRARTTGSTGLGLAIVQSVVAAQGGTVSVRSAPGDTVFTVTLPLAARPMAPQPRAPHPTASRS